MVFYFRKELSYFYTIDLLKIFPKEQKGTEKEKEKEPF